MTPLYSPLMDVLDEAQSHVLDGAAAEADGHPLAAIECYESAIDLLVEDREAFGARLPHVEHEAQGLGHLLRVLVAIEDDDAPAVLVHMLDRWDDARSLDPSSVETPRFVKAMDSAGHRAMRFGDLGLARRAFQSGWDVAQMHRDSWLRDARVDRARSSGAKAVLDIESLRADILKSEGSVRESAEVLRSSIDLVDDLGFFPISFDRPSQLLLGEAHLVSRFIDRAIPSDWDARDLQLMFGRYWELLAATFDAAIVEGDETKAALMVRMSVDALRKASACGKAHELPALSAQVRARVDDWSMSDSVIARVVAGDVSSALEALT